jgi:hypothetical protein
MVIECPECHERASQGTNHQQLVELAEEGNLVCTCFICGHSWKPSLAEQKLIAANLRAIDSLSSLDRYE